MCSGIIDVDHSMARQFAAESNVNLDSTAQPDLPQPRLKYMCSGIIDASPSTFQSPPPKWPVLLGRSLWQRDLLKDLGACRHAECAPALLKAEEGLDFRVEEQDAVLAQQRIELEQQQEHLDFNRIERESSYADSAQLRAQVHLQQHTQINPATSSSWVMPSSLFGNLRDSSLSQQTAPCHVQ